MRRMFAVWVLLTCSVCLAYGQENFLVLGKKVDPHKGVDRIYSDFSESYRTFDDKKLADLYTEDVAYLSPSRNIVFGRKQVAENFRGFFDRVKESGRTMEIKFTILKRRVEGEIGYDVGIFDLVYTREGKVVTEAKGKFVVALVKDKDRKWRFAVDGYSDLNPN